jgi:hypothetical protein
MAMLNSVTLVVSSIFMLHFEENAFGTADHKHAKWLRDINTFIVWPCGPARLQQFLCHFSSVRPSIKFTMEIEANDILLFFDILFMKRAPELTAKVNWKTTHTGHYLHFKSTHPHHAKKKVVHSLISQAKVMFWDQKDFIEKIKNIRHDLVLNEYPKEY